MEPKPFREILFQVLLASRLTVFYWLSEGDRTDVIRSINRQAFTQAFDETNIDELTMIQLDTKYDDEKPESGEIRLLIADGSGAGCLTLTAPADYDFTASGDFQECYPSFIW